MSIGLNLGGAIRVTDTLLQNEMVTKFNEAEERNEQLGKITTLLQNINKHQEDGQLKNLQNHPGTLTLIHEVMEFAPELTDKLENLKEGEMPSWEADDLDRLKQNINHEIKKVESNQKMMMDLAIHRMGEHKNIYDALLETIKRVSQMGDTITRNQRS